MKKALGIAAAVCALASAGFAVASLTALKTVNIKSTGFVPKTVTVTGGDTVQWKNVDTASHQVVANDGAFVSGTITPQHTFSKLMDTPGTYPYHDALKPTLKGTVKVIGPPPSVSIAASVPIVTFGNQIRIGGGITPPAVGDTVSAFARAYGQVSFSKLNDVLTTTNGVWDLVVSPQILTSYEATWKGKTSAVIMVAVSPRLSLGRIGSWFVTRAQAGRSFYGRWVYFQRLNSFGQWVNLKQVILNQQSAQRFRASLPRGRSLVRTYMTTNQAGAGYVFAASPALRFRRR
jgi:plastocyanin